MTIPLKQKQKDTEQIDNHSTSQQPEGKLLLLINESLLSLLKGFAKSNTILVFHYTGKRGDDRIINYMGKCELCLMLQSLFYTNTRLIILIEQGIKS